MIDPPGVRYPAKLYGYWSKESIPLKDIDPEFRSPEKNCGQPGPQGGLTSKFDMGAENVTEYSSVCVLPRSVPPT